jgi:predicted glycosyltransferase
LLNVGIKPDSTFFILRFVSWRANHDINQTGFTDIQKIKLVETLKHYGKVYISAENEKIPLSLKKYLIRIPSNLIHQLLFFSSLYVGDSQSMTTEAALLGTPALRYNSFVGEHDMSNFKILEKKELAFSFSSFEILLQRIHHLLNDSESKLLWQEKRKNYFLNKADVNKQIIDILNI